MDLWALGYAKIPLSKWQKAIKKVLYGCQIEIGAVMEWIIQNNSSY
tara:strand:- start:471 stop:608 length:138 start_codon:yes stop_codon:yes gene_type:complete